MFQLACPNCHKNLALLTMWREPADEDLHFDCDCGESYFELDGIPNLFPSYTQNSSDYLFETGRYDKVSEDQKTYHGYLESKPQQRAELLKSLIGDAKEVVELGPGFGELLKILEIPALAIEQSWGFINYLQENLKHNYNFEIVRGGAEYLPLATESIECFVADGVFQSVIDRELFLYELWRVCKPGARIVFTIAHKWNYPRRPQDGFNINKFTEYRTLQRFLEELSFEHEFKWYNLELNDWVETKKESDYLYILGTKR